MEKLKEYLPIVCIVLLSVVFLNTCGTKGKIKSLKKEVDQLETTVAAQDSIIAGTISEEKLVKYLEIEGLKTSKRNLYDQNYIIRTKVRPDDRMNEYDTEIKKLENTLK